MLINPDKDELEYEEALDRLENIIAALNDGSLSIDESLKLFEEGVGLVRICEDKLNYVETKISLLLGNKTGSYTEVPFKLETEE